MPVQIAAWSMPSRQPTPTEAADMQVWLQAEGDPEHLWTIDPLEAPSICTPITMGQGQHGRMPMPGPVENMLAQRATSRLATRAAGHGQASHGPCLIWF